MEEDKHYWAIYYGIDKALPIKEFCQKIKDINSLAEQSAKRFTERTLIFSKSAKSFINKAL